MRISPLKTIYTLNGGRLLLIGCYLLLLSGCIGIQTSDRSVATDPIPPQWQTHAAAEALPLEHDWWLNFDSVTLEVLLDQAQLNSPDFAIMAERLIQAEAQLRISGASLFPSLNVSGATSRRSSHSDGGSTVSGESSSLSLGASYEVDLFGRIAADLAAAEASFRATEFDLAATRLSLLTGVATAYFQQLATNERLSIARANLAIAQRVLAIVDQRLRFGSSSQLDYDRQRSTVLGQRASILTLEEQLRQLTSALGLLLGQSPQQFTLTPETINRVQIPTVTPYLPSELLLRRPDLARTEAQLQTAEANLAAARAALFPSINLTSSLGMASSTLLSLTNPTTSFSLAASVSQALFDGGRRRNQVTVAQSRQQEAVENYRKAILTSLKEVEDALDRVNVSAAQKQIQDEIVTLAQGNLLRAEHRYREGADELLNLLDTQRSLFSAQEQLIQLHLAQLNAALDLYKALGGGWRQQPATTDKERP